MTASAPNSEALTAQIRGGHYNNYAALLVSDAEPFVSTVSYSLSGFH